MFSHFWNCLTLLDVSGFNESGYNRQVTKVGVSMSAGGSSMHRTGGGCCVQSRGIMGEKKSLNTLQKQTLQSSMAYSDALTMKLLGSQPTRLLLNVTGSAMLTVCPSHGPSPPIPTVYHFQIYFTLNIAHPVTPAFLIQNVVCLNEGFTPYPCCLYIKITWTCF